MKYIIFAQMQPTNLVYSVCLARGRNYVLPMSPLIESCDQWHLNELADRWDGSIVSVAVLRRDLVFTPFQKWKITIR